MDRRTNPASRREVALNLTDAGRDLVGRVMAHRQAEVTALVARLPAEERGDLVPALRAARLRGEAMGSRDAAVPSTSEDPLGCALAALERLGFEPEILAEPGSATVTVLRNCPFHPVAAQAPSLVCGMNHAFVEGYLTGLGDTTATPVLNPRPGSCCVELRTNEEGVARGARPPRVACDREST
ncbi:helix-turn-helix domain-containing protein [Streptomyces violascens]|uniref:hypothetical protein n=1 Tax=Streptomyces violascens TaxID=67381 RepID=UPI00364BBC8D